MINIILIILFSLLFSDNVNISSFLIDSHNIPIKYANIQCDDTGTSSDIDGYFFISCSEHSNLTISHINYETTILPLNSIQNTITLKNTLISLNQVNVYGQFNNQSKKVTSTQIIKKISSHNNFINDISSSISNLNYASGTSTPRYFQIRGLGELSQFSGEGAPNYYIGLTLDNIDFSGLSLPLTLFDINQIEVFKGPNSTLFGQNATGGNIHITTNDPHKYKSYTGSFNLGNYNSSSINLRLSNSLTDNLFYNTSMSKYYSDGWIKNKQLNEGNSFYRYDTNSINHESLQYKLLFDKNNMIIKTTYIYAHANNKYDIWAPDNNGYTTYTDYRGVDSQKTNAFSLYIENSKPMVDIIGISTYADNAIIYSYDSDWGNNEFWTNEPYNYDNYYYDYYAPYSYTDYTDRKRINSSNELRIIFKKSKYLNITTGLTQNNIKEYDTRDGWLFAGNATNISSTFNIKNSAFYTEFLIKNINQLECTIGLRNDNNTTHNSILWSDWYDNSNVLNYKISSNNLTAGSIKLEYDFFNKLNLISFFSTGYKPKGINQSPNTPNDYKLYDLETSYNYDLGLEYHLENFNLNLSIFYIFRKNPQLRVFYQYDNTNPNSFDYAVFNSKYGQNNGLEIDINSSFNNKLFIDVSIGYLRTYISDFTYNDVIYGDREQAHAPHYTYHLSFDYKLFENTLYNISFHGMDSFYFDDQNDHQSNKRNLADSSIEYKNNLFSLRFWSKNIFNSKYQTRGYTFGLEPPSYEVKDYKAFGSPRTFGITFEYDI